MIKMTWSLKKASEKKKDDLSERGKLLLYGDFTPQNDL